MFLQHNISYNNKVQSFDDSSRKLKIPREMRECSQNINKSAVWYRVIISDIQYKS